MGAKKKAAPTPKQTRPAKAAPAQRAQQAASEAAPESSGGKAARRARTTEKINIWLPPDQAAWLKSKKNISETVRAMITEAMSIENLARSVKVAKKK